jgi:hypothetical protein
VPRLRLGTRSGPPRTQAPLGHVIPEALLPDAAATKGRRPSDVTTRRMPLGNDVPYFTTLPVNHRLYFFTGPETVEIVLDSHRQANHDFRLDG